MSAAHFKAKADRLRAQALRLFVEECCAEVESYVPAKVFDQRGCFEALNAARDWCKAHGVSYGSLQGDAPIGLLVGEHYISKWRNLSKSEIAELDGTMTGDGRNGPITIRIKSSAMARIGGDV